MDAKITKQRLARMLSYDWLKIVATIAAVIFAWVVIFTTTATRITAAQKFTVFNYTGNVNLERTKFYTSYNKAFSSGVFSHEVLELSQVDVAMEEKYGATLVQTRTSIAEGDVVMIADIDDPKARYEKDGQTVCDSYLQSFIGLYGHMLYNLDREAEDGFFKKMERYLNAYYTDGDYTSGTLNKEAVEKDFRARVKKNKDKRYKKEAQIKQGIADDIERIEKYSAALTEFYSYLDGGTIALTNTQILDRESGEVLLEGTYSINLCPVGSNMGGLSSVFAYEKTVVNAETGAQQKVLSAENMNVAFFDFDEVEEGFAYESLLYVNYLVRTVLAAQS